MEEAKFNNLCSHYEGTFGTLQLALKKRDNLFYILLVLLAVFTLQLSSADIVVDAVNDFSEKSVGIRLGNRTDLISTLMWLLVLGFSTKYFQVVIDIERQYTYLHSLETELNYFYSNSVAFTGEGKGYLSEYPMFSNWVSFLYTIFFPILIIISITVKILEELSGASSIGINQLINFSCFLIILTSSILYLFRLHK